MAIAIRGSLPTTDTDVASATLSLTLTGTSQPQTGDVLLIIHCNGYFNFSNMPTPTVAGSTTGVTAVTGGSADGGANTAHVKSYTYAVGSTGDLTVAVTETGTADEEKALIVYVLSGVDTTTPVDVAGGVYNAALAVLRAPSISPTSSDAYLICHVNSGTASSGGSTTPPGGMAETADFVVGGIMNVGEAVLQLSASGATGNKDFTGSVPHAGLSVAMKAGGAAAPDRNIPGRRIYVLP